jgi:fructosamine-3-kinase
MFQTEKLGLEEIADTKSIRTPEIHLCGQTESISFLVMNYIKSKTPDSKDFQKLGIQIARLHQCHKKEYGWTEDNYIGALPQANEIMTDWITFYVKNRLLPQMTLAKHQRFFDWQEAPDMDKMMDTCHLNLQSGHPCLLHGDLWAGNYLIDQEGIPYLIDPAVYYGHHQVDMAMSCLFGGFDQIFYNSYYDQLSAPWISEVEKDLYQLYYLLVHLNLFGGAYYHPVRRILDKYF